MTLPVFWLPEADADLQAARDWYEAIRPELGERFARAVQRTLEIVAEHPAQFPVVHRGRRRAGVHRFPYGLFFEVQEHRIVVIACLHAKRNPEHWQQRQIHA